MVNNKTPLVSIGMCVYNEGKYIAKSIESILQQDYKNLELIITDNCSQDNTQEICLQYAKKDDRVRYYRYRCNIGVLRTFNFTFELTQGNYFMLAGGHDLWDKSFVSRCVEILNSDDKVVLCYTFGNMIDIDDRYITSLRGVDTRDLTIEERMHLALEQKTNLAICGLMRTEAINKIMPIKYSEIPGGDEVMLLELSTLGTFAYIREPLFYLRKVREEKSEEETITRILKMTNPFREQCEFKTYILDTLESILQVIDRLKINKKYKSSLTANLVHTLKKRFGERSLKQGEALGSEIIEKYGNINIEDIDFLTMREACLTLKHINLALLFHPDSSILQEAYNLLIKLNFPLSKNQAKQDELKKTDNKNEKPLPRVSVIVPTRDRPNFLLKALDSIARQTYKNIEVVVVNDGGEDVSQIINAFRDRLTIKYLTHDINKDRSAARNTAIKHASGQYIAYLDDDDIFHPHHVETAVKVLTTTDYKVVYTDACRAYQIKSGDTYQTIKKDVPYSVDYVKGIFYKTNITPILCVVHDRMCFNEIGVFDESLPVLEDWDLWIRMAEKYDFYHIKKVTCEFSWRVDGTSTTSRKQNEFAMVRELIYKKYYQKFQDALMQTPAVARKPVSIIILTWNALEYTQKCVNSIQNHTRYPHEIIFVDNASTDGTVESLRRLVQGHSNYKLIENRENKGFAAGNNQGVKAAGGEYVMLLNNDVLVSDGWLENLVESLERNKNIGMVGPITNSISGRQQVIEIPYTDEQEFYKFAQGIRGTYKGRLTPRYRVAGFAVLMKKALYEEVGGLDESFGTGNYEDDDLCLKVQEKGYAIMVDESVFIHHYRSQTFIENKIDYSNSLSVNGSKFKEKWSNVDYEQLLELQGSLVDANAALCARGKQALESGNINEAIEIYLKVLQTNPIDEAALCGLGLAYQMDGKTDKTIDAYRKALKANPSSFDAYYNLALVYANNNQIDDAIVHFNKAIDLNDGDATIYNNLGVLYFKKNSHDDAKSCFERALLIDAHYKEAQQNLNKVSKVFEKV